MSWLVEQQLCSCEGREHLAPTGGMALGRCRKLWPRPTVSATPHLLCLPRRCVMGRGAGLGRMSPPPRHLHQGPETCLQSQLDKRFSVKETQGVTLSICSPLHSATEDRRASLLQGGGPSGFLSQQGQGKRGLVCTESWDWFQGGRWLLRLREHFLGQVCRVGGKNHSEK